MGAYTDKQRGARAQCRFDLDQNLCAFVSVSVCVHSAEILKAVPLQSLITQSYFKKFIYYYYYFFFFTSLMCDQSIIPACLRIDFRVTGFINQSINVINLPALNRVTFD